MADDFQEVPLSREPAPPGPGHNRPPVDLAELVAAIPAQLANDNKDLVDRVGVLEEKAKLVPDPLTNDEDAKKIADFVSLLAAGEKRRDDRFKEAKRPWLDGGRAVDTFFNGIKVRIGGLDAKLRRIALAWDDKKEADAKAAAAEERRRQQEEAERQRKAAEELAAAGKLEQAQTRAEHAERHEQAAAKQEQIAAAPPPSATRVTGAVGSLGARRRWVYEIQNRDLIPREYLEPSDALIKAAITTFKARDQLRDGETSTTLIPGVKLYQEKSMGR